MNYVTVLQSGKYSNQDKNLLKGPEVHLNGQKEELANEDWWGITQSEETASLHRPSEGHGNTGQTCIRRKREKETEESMEYMGGEMELFSLACCFCNFLQALDALVEDQSSVPIAMTGSSKPPQLQTQEIKVSFLASAHI